MSAGGIAARHNDAGIPARIPATPGDRAAAALTPMMEMVLGARLTFDQHIDADLLGRATRLLLDLEPVLGCWLDERSHGGDWVRCESLDDIPLLSLAQTDDPDRDAAAFHGAPFGAKGPRLAVMLLRSPDHDDVCLRFDHLVGDGWSAMETAHLLAETYTRLSIDPAYVPAPRLDARPTHDVVWDALADEQRAVARTVPPMIGLSKWRVRAPRGKGDSLAARTLTLPEARVAQVRAYAHERGATVNEALIAALIRCSATMFPQKRGSRPAVSISSDTRRLVSRPELDRIANIATTQTVPMGFEPGESFEATLRHVVRGLRPYKTALWSIGATQGPSPKVPMNRAGMRLLTSMVRLTHRGGELVTMNIGPFDAQRLTFAGVRPTSAAMMGPIPRYSGFPATISYYLGALTIWTGVRERWLAPECVERYLRGIDEELAVAEESAS